MREIKFRVWDKLKNRYSNPKEHYGIITFENGEICGDGFDIEPAYLLEQYTGLKDQNGKEIYEGDKIKTYRFICKNGKQAIEYYDKIINSEDFHHDCYILGNIIDSGRTVEIIYESK